MGSKTTITTGEWSYLISFAFAPLSCSYREGSEKFKMKMYISSGIKTHDVTLKSNPRLKMTPESFYNGLRVDSQR